MCTVGLVHNIRDVIVGFQNYELDSIDGLCRMWLLFRKIPQTGWTNMFLRENNLLLKSCWNKAKKKILRRKKCESQYAIVTDWKLINFKFLIVSRLRCSGDNGVQECFQGAGFHRKYQTANRKRDRRWRVGFQAYGIVVFGIREKLRQGHIANGKKNRYIGEQCRWIIDNVRRSKLEN